MNRRAVKEQLREADRLDGWKRIATYLDCDVRTARRWEKVRDLPVHRHYHRRQASVYAFTAELDAWAAGETPASALPAAETHRYRVLATSAAGAAVVLIAGAILLPVERAGTSGAEPQIPTETSPYPTVIATGLEQAWTDNDWNDWGVKSDGRNFIWRADMAGDSEIFAWRDGLVTQVTNDGEVQHSAAISDSRIAWLEGPDCFEDREDGWDCAVWVYERGAARQLTNDRAFEGGPVGRDGAFVWERYVESVGDGLDVYVYRDGVLERITGEPASDRNPVVSGQRIVWESIVGDAWELFEYDGAVISQLTDNDVPDRQPSIDGKWLAWVQYDGNDDEIMLSDGQEVWQLTNNEIDDVKPQIRSGRVAWVAKTRRVDGNNPLEIMAFDGATVYQLTDDGQLDWKPAVSDDYIVWHRMMDTDLEIVAVAWEDLGDMQLAKKGQRP